MNMRLFVIPLTVALLAGACRGGEGDPTLEEYFLEVRAIVNEYREEQGEFVIEQQAREEDSDTVAELFLNDLNAILPPLRDIVDGFQDLDAPVEVIPAHGDASESLRIILEVLADLETRLDVAESDDDSVEILRQPRPEFDAAIAMLDETCFKLQGIAGDHNIDVDLDCELGLLQGRQFLVEGDSMLPIFPNGTVVEHSDYGDASPKLGDIVVFRSPTNPDREIIKRVIGVPGDSVEILPESNQVLLNGEVIEEPYVQGTTRCAQECAWTVPPDSYFLMGDNRQNSSDSRQGWFVPDENILGRVEE